MKEPPSTRYQGSKRKLLPWIAETLEQLEFDTMLDAFGGTGCVAYHGKRMGKVVSYNDIQPFNEQIAIATLENQQHPMPAEAAQSMFLPVAQREYNNLIEATFEDTYYTTEENQWLDRVIQNLPDVSCRFQRAICYYALFQACLIKRPYNLFHRKNLYMRLSDVHRRFGNKSSWDRSFESHFLAFLDEANASVFAGKCQPAVFCGNAVDVPGEFDLVYIDTPYLNAKGQGVDYGDFYHFLNGLLQYDNWLEHIDWKRKHRPLLRGDSPWHDPKRIHQAFADVFDRFQNSALLVSYRSDGIPSVGELRELLSRFKTNVEIKTFGQYNYALSTSRSQEVMLLGS